MLRYYVRKRNVIGRVTTVSRAYAKVTFTTFALVDSICYSRGHLDTRGIWEGYRSCGDGRRDASRRLKKFPILNIGIPF
jgi:hypothetical protein